MGGTTREEETVETHHDRHGADERSAHSGHEGHGAHLGHDAHPGHGGHDAHEGHSVAMFRDRFWLSLLLSVPVLLWSQMLQELLGYSAPSVPADRWIPLVFGTAVFVYGGSPFLRGGWNELRDRAPGMMLLISLAITVAFASSLASEAGLLDLDFWWELVLLIDVMLLGHWQEMKAIGQASRGHRAGGGNVAGRAPGGAGAGPAEGGRAAHRPGVQVRRGPRGRGGGGGTQGSGGGGRGE